MTCVFNGKYDRTVSNDETTIRKAKSKACDIKGKKTGRNVRNRNKKHLSCIVVVEKRDISCIMKMICH